MKDLINLVFIILVVTLSRLIPHYPNMTAIGASSIWLAYSFPKKYYALVIPVLALFISDMLLGFHNQMLWVYGATLLTSFILIKNSVEFSVKSLTESSLITAVLFFIITNFGVWFTGGFYSSDIQGLAQCFVAGIPFAVNDILGTLFYGSIGLLSIQKLDILISKPVKL